MLIKYKYPPTVVFDKQAFLPHPPMLMVKRKTLYHVVRYVENINFHGFQVPSCLLVLRKLVEVIGIVNCGESKRSKSLPFYA